MKVGDRVRIGSDFIDAGRTGVITDTTGPWIYVEGYGVYHEDDLELAEEPTLKVEDNKARIFYRDKTATWEIVEEPNQWDALEDTLEYEIPKTVLTPRGKKTEWVKREDATIPYVSDSSPEFTKTITLPEGTYVVTLPIDADIPTIEEVNAKLVGGRQFTVEGAAKKNDKEYEMTTEEYFEFIDKVCEEMKELVKTKNADYTSGVSPFANFKASARFGVDPLVGLSVRIGDKIQRLQSYCSKGELQVKGEGIKEVFKDLIGYSWLALGMLEEKERNN